MFYSNIVRILFMNCTFIRIFNFFLAPFIEKNILIKNNVGNENNSLDSKIYAITHDPWLTNQHD